MSRWSTDQIAGWVRFVIAPLLGAAGIVNEAFLRSGDPRQFLLLFFAAMMGIPIPGVADFIAGKSGKKESENDAVKDDTGPHKAPKVG